MSFYKVFAMAVAFLALGAQAEDVAEIFFNYDEDNTIKYSNLAEAWNALGTVQPTTSITIRKVTLRILKTQGITNTFSTAGIARNVVFDLNKYTLYNGDPENFTGVYFNICNNPAYSFKLTADGLNGGIYGSEKWFKPVDKGVWEFTGECPNMESVKLTAYNGGTYRTSYSPVTGAKDSVLSINNGVTVEVRNLALIGNSCRKSRGGGDGGAIKCNDGYLNCYDVYMVGNMCEGRGGAVGVYHRTLKDTGTTHNNPVRASFQRCWIFNNYAKEEGGGIMLGTPAAIYNSQVHDNWSDLNAGGIFLKVAQGSTFNADGTESASSGTGSDSEEEACFPAGTKITMADGTSKNVEDVKAGDVVATFNHFGGTNATAQVYYADKGTGTLPKVALTFASGAKLTLVAGHGLLLQDTRKYVKVSYKNAADFIGKSFWNAERGAWDELVAADAAGTCREYYYIYSAHDINCVANGLLTLPDDVFGLVNFLELDANLKADAAQLAADVAQYGLADAADYPQVPAFVFEAVNAKYGLIAIGKGLTTLEALLDCAAEGDFDTDELAQETSAATLAPKRAMAAARLQSITGDLSCSKITETFSAPTLVVLDRAEVMNNYAGTITNYWTHEAKTSEKGFASNVFLYRGDNDGDNGNGLNPNIRIYEAGTTAHTFKMGIRVYQAILSEDENYDWPQTGAQDYGRFTLAHGEHDTYLDTPCFWSDDGSYSIIRTYDDLREEYHYQVHAGGIQCGDAAFFKIDEEGNGKVSGIGNIWGKGQWDTTTIKYKGRTYTEPLPPLLQFRRTLKTLTIEDGITEVNEYAFADFCNLESVTIGSSVYYIEPYVFYNCTSLTNINYKNSSMGVGRYAIPLVAPTSQTDTDDYWYFPDGFPTNYPIPRVTAGSKEGVLQGKKNKGDAWTNLGNLTPAERTAYKWIRIYVR